MELKEAQRYAELPQDEKLVDIKEDVKVIETNVSQDIKIVDAPDNDIISIYGDLLDPHGAVYIIREKCAYGLIGMIFFMMIIAMMTTWHYQIEPYDSICGFGYSVANDTCICYEYYARNIHDTGFPINSVRSEGCFYKRKSLTTAMLGQIFFGFTGFTFWYIGAYELASTQLSITLIHLVALRIYIKRYFPSTRTKQQTFLMLSLSLIVMLWFISVVMLRHFPYDSNGVFMANINNSPKHNDDFRV